MPQISKNIPGAVTKLYERPVDSTNHGRSTATGNAETDARKIQFFRIGKERSHHFFKVKRLVDLSVRLVHQNKNKRDFLFLISLQYLKLPSNRENHCDITHSRRRRQHHNQR